MPPQLRLGLIEHAQDDDDDDDDDDEGNDFNEVRTVV